MARGRTTSQLNIAELQRILDQRKSELSKLHKQRNDAQKALDAIDREIARIGGGSAGGRSSGGRVRNEVNLPDSIASVLQSAGKPMSVGDIMQAVRAGGYRSNSPSFRGIVNQALIKDKRFTSSERGIYGLKSAGTSARSKKSKVDAVTA